MIPVHLTYLFIEFAIFLTMLIFVIDIINWKKILSKQFFVVLFLLFILWFIIDQIAIMLELWHFPEGGTFSARIFNLPIEEYIIFLLHTIIVVMLLEIFNYE